MSERLAKFMARSGVCSRRRAEEYIRQKRVTVNGEVVDSPAFNVEGTEKILFDGEKLPENGWSRRYKVKVHGYVDLKRLSALEKGAVVDGVSYGPVKAEVETEKGTNAWLIVTLSEGKNREIRKLMKSIGLDVARLIRLSYGPFQLGSLKKGEVREVPGKVLKEQLGSKFQL